MTSNCHIHFELPMNAINLQGSRRVWEFAQPSYSRLGTYEVYRILNLQFWVSGAKASHGGGPCARPGTSNSCDAITTSKIQLWVCGDQARPSSNGPYITFPSSSKIQLWLDSILFHREAGSSSRPITQHARPSGSQLRAHTIFPSSHNIQFWLNSVHCHREAGGSGISTIQLWNECGDCSNSPNNGVPASVIPLKRPISPPPPSTPPQALVAEHTPKFNFGWKQPPSTTVAVATHVGFDHNNKSFQFSCKVPPAKVGEWTPAPITAAIPQAALVPMVVLAPIIAAVPEAAPAPESDPYTPKALPNWEGAFPAAKQQKLNSTSQVTCQDTIGHLMRRLVACRFSGGQTRNLVRWWYLLYPSWMAP
ncbi:uncharacterized protein F5147DRAFT_661563 [Suillus discolor]|uniref:Uncharacterized protein n=1 Tax=Suillus discolor TaxID=1912936 RepID=A0A9P7EPV3_9AGAM|nr:uncharacterized protein F5147DRAFT_661563 [Suillus discolor]KAG2079943.1 hypothetical protein F5147DRAFT_661563 [Suillus discolor]